MLGNCLEDPKRNLGAYNKVGGVRQGSLNQAKLTQAPKVPSGGLGQGGSGQAWEEGLI